MKKVYNSLLIIDGSYLLHRNLRSTELAELEDSQGNKTGGIFGFLRSFSNLLRFQGYYPVICWDHGRNKRRLDVFPNYKDDVLDNVEIMINDLLLENFESNKQISDEDITNKVLNTLNDDKYIVERLGKINHGVNDLIMFKTHLNENNVKTTLEIMRENQRKFGKCKDPDNYQDQYMKQRDEIVEICNALSIPSIKIKGEEGDDLMTILTRLSKKSIIITDDKDLQQLVSENVENYRPMADELVTVESLKNNKNRLTSRRLAIHKAIIGDTSDEIPGMTKGNDRANCIGDAGAWQFVDIIDKHDENEDLFLTEIKFMPKNNKAIGFINCYENYKRNMQLVDLSLVEATEELKSKIIAEIDLISSREINLFTVLGKLSSRSIMKLDVQTLMSNIINAKLNLKIKEEVC
jgi:5''-3'' exonuclease (including N-terminal domain of PolI)